MGGFKMEKADCLKHRKSSVVIAVQRPDGSPVSKREVEIRQTGHSFLFGCGAFETLNITDSDSGPEKRAFYEERMEKWLKLFKEEGVECRYPELCDAAVLLGAV